MKSALKQAFYVIVIALGFFLVSHYQLLVALAGITGLFLAGLGGLLVLGSSVILIASFYTSGSLKDKSIT